MTHEYKHKYDFSDSKLKMEKKNYVSAATPRPKSSNKKITLITQTERYEDMCVFKKLLHIKKT